MVKHHQKNVTKKSVIPDWSTVDNRDSVQWDSNAMEGIFGKLTLKKQKLVSGRLSHSHFNQLMNQESDVSLFLRFFNLWIIQA